MKSKMQGNLCCLIGLLSLILFGAGGAVVAAQEENEPQAQFSAAQNLTITENPTGGWVLKKNPDIDGPAEFRLALREGNVCSGTLLSSPGDLRISIEETDKAIVLHITTAQTAFSGHCTTYAGQTAQVQIGADSEIAIAFKIRGNLLVENISGTVDINGEALAEGSSRELRRKVPPPPLLETEPQGRRRASDPNP
ncbi:MAG: hypothetical protein GY801_25180 [bacterium]|nr:hypothetical protein [bacterium]